jgi:hypothetical protein
MKHFHLHLVSDSTGETVSSVARASLAQFDGVHAEEHVWSLVRTQGQLEKMIASLDVYPGLVMFTLMDNAMRETLRHACGKRGLPCIPVLGQVIREMGSYLDQEATGHTGAQYELGEDYFARIDAINYALEHDDGQATWEIENAIGVDQFTPMDVAIAARANTQQAVQGNLDPLLIASNKDEALRQTEVILQKLTHTPSIFNLGHGFIPSTPIENVAAVSNFVKAWRR